MILGGGEKKKKKNDVRVRCRLWHDATEQECMDGWVSGCFFEGLLLFSVSAYPGLRSLNLTVTDALMMTSTQVPSRGR